jgi:hypothetical protein
MLLGIAQMFARVLGTLPADLRHPDINQHNVRIEPVQLLEGLERREEGAHKRMILPTARFSISATSSRN